MYRNDSVKYIVVGSNKDIVGREHLISPQPMDEIIWKNRGW